MPHILDIPLELFSEIVHFFVCNVGFADAVQARHTCRSFAQAIYHDICSRHAISKFRGLSLHRRSRLLVVTMPDVLSNMKPANCRAHYLHEHMDAVIEYMHANSPHVSKDRRAIYKKQLCNAIAAALHSETIINHLLYSPLGKSTTIWPNMARADTVGMLAAVGNLTALTFLIGKVRTARTRSKIYGPPLLAAAVNGQIQAAAFIYHHIRHEESCGSHMWHVIKTCIYNRRTVMLPTLLVWFYRLDLDCDTIEETKRYCTAWAVRTGHLDVLQICHVPYRYNPAQRRHYRKECRRPYQDFRDACRYGHEVVVRFYMSFEPLSRCKHSPAHGLMDIGLHVAARHGQLGVAKYLLDSGARVNELVSINRKGARTALARAVRGNYVAVVLLLLEYGARVSVSDPQATKLDTERFARLHGGLVLSIIKQAKQLERPE